MDLVELSEIQGNSVTVDIVMGKKIFRVYPNIYQDKSWLQMRMLRMYFALFSSFGIAEKTEVKKWIVLNKSHQLIVQIHVNHQKDLKISFFEILVELCSPISSYKSR